MLATHRIGDFRNWAHIEAWARAIADGPGRRRPPRSPAGCRAGESAQRGVKLRGVGPQPAPVGRVVRDPRRHEVPETRPVPEDPQMAQLVDDDRLEDRAAVPARAARPASRGPARDALPQRLRVSRTAIAVGATPSGPAWRAIASSTAAAGPDAQPRLEDRGERPSLGRGEGHEQDVLVVGADALHAGAAAPRAFPRRRAPGAARRGSAGATRLRAPRRRPPRRRAPPGGRGAAGSTTRARRGTAPRGRGPPPPAIRTPGTVAITPRRGSIVTRRRRARAERRSVYGRSPPGRRATAGVSREPAAAALGTPGGRPPGPRHRRCRFSTVCRASAIRVARTAAAKPGSSGERRERRAHEHAEQMIGEGRVPGEERPVDVRPDDAARHRPVRGGRSPVAGAHLQARERGGARTEDRAAVVGLEAHQLGEAGRECGHPHHRPVDERAERRLDVQEAEAIVLSTLGIHEGPAGHLEAGVDGEEDGPIGNGRGQRSLVGEAAGELGQVLVRRPGDLVEVGGRQRIARLHGDGPDGDPLRGRTMLEHPQVAGVGLGHGESGVDVGKEQDAGRHRSAAERRREGEEGGVVGRHVHGARRERADRPGRDPARSGRRARRRASGGPRRRPGSRQPPPSARRAARTARPRGRRNPCRSRRGPP